MQIQRVKKVEGLWNKEEKLDRRTKSISYYFFNVLDEVLNIIYSALSHTNLFF